MQEKIIEIGQINPIELFGANDAKLKTLQKYFPKLKIIARGTSLKIIGEEDLIIFFEKKLELMIRHFHKYNKLTENNIESLMMEDGDQLLKDSEGDDVLFYGNGGNKIKAQTPGQRRMVESLATNDMLFAVGPAGTGKTYTAVALAVKALKNKEIKRIILTRPAVEAGENLGFLPGDLKEKLDPYLQPLYDGLRDMIPAEKLEEFMDQGIIQVAPLGFMRGRTLDKAFVILDEAQNATESQMKMFLTRMGKKATFIINGDTSQIDLPKHQRSGLVQALKVLKGVDGIGFVMLDGRDIVRHRLVKKIIDAFDGNFEDK